MPHIDWTISLSNLLGYVAALAALGWRLYHAIDKRVAVFEEIVNHHTKTLKTHDERMDKHEDRLISLLSQLQRLIGRSEVELTRRESEP